MLREMKGSGQTTAQGLVVCHLTLDAFMYKECEWPKF